MSDFLKPHGLSSARNSPGQNTGVGSLSLLQGIFPTQGSNPGLPHCRRILYQLSHKERVVLYTVVFNMPYYNVYWPPQKWNIDHLNSFSIITYTCLRFSSLHLPFALLWLDEFLRWIISITCFLDELYQLSSQLHIQSMAIWTFLRRELCSES